MKRFACIFGLCILLNACGFSESDAKRAIHKSLESRGNVLTIPVLSTPGKGLDACKVALHQLGHIDYRDGLACPISDFAKRYWTEIDSSSISARTIQKGGCSRGYVQLHVPVALQNLQITGIKESAKGVRSVEFRFERVPEKSFTLPSECYGNWGNASAARVQILSSAYFEKYSDGWRFQFFGEPFVQGSAVLEKPPILERAAASTNSSAQGASHPPNSSRSAGLDPQWFGKWKSQDGKVVIEFSSAKASIDSSHNSPPNRDEMKWAANSASIEAGEFGYEGGSTSVAEIAKRFEEANRFAQKKEPDFAASDPVESRQAIASISPGRYKVLLGRPGVEKCSDSKWIVDGDKMLAMVDCKYFFGVFSFSRVK